MRCNILLATITVFTAACGFARAEQPPVIPVGLDAYRQWDRWPIQRIGARAYMRSTYDRRGGNEGADASHFLHQLRDDYNVTLDLQGAGILCFARYNHWHGSPWHYVVDGVDHNVQETSTKDPDHPTENSTFLPAEALPSPLTWTWSTTKGADLMWVPIGFQDSFQMAYSRTHYGTGYYIFHRYVPDAQLSQPIKSWDGKTPPDAHVLKLVGTPADQLEVPGEEVAFQSKHRIDGGGVIRKLAITFPKAEASKMSRARLRVTWDDRAEPSVDVPLCLFFGAGSFFNRDDREYLVKAFPVTVRFVGENIELACVFPMPFFKSATIELSDATAKCRVVKDSLKGELNEHAYFHATYLDHPTPEKGKDLVLLDTKKVEGGGDWTGSFVGTSFIFSHNAVLTTLEGDPRFFFDDSESPQAQGTGTEEWGGGGDYWGGRNMTLPFAGHPCGAKDAKEAKNDEDKIESAYRVLLADLFPFGKNARITLEHGGTNESAEHYETVTYWYGLPGASVVKTDSLQVGDQPSEESHKYVSPDASDPYDIKSRFELGVDSPELMDVGRYTRGTSEFSVKVDPQNFGVMLRRKLDYAFANQRAEVFVEGEKGEWKPAGVWYLAGSNASIYSNPKEELGETRHVVQQSNRRFREDEFLISSALTRGRKNIRVRVKFTPVNIDLAPGVPQAMNAWSEIRYNVYSFVMPLMPR